MLPTPAKELLPPRHSDASWARCRCGLVCVDEKFLAKLHLCAISISQKAHASDRGRLQPDPHNH